jgi:proline iminopeptidase
MHTLYPCIRPNETHYISVENPHVLYVEESGNPQGIPVIVLHAGPGAGGDSHLRRFFDPLKFRIILSDQRGCGRSTPNMHLSNNTTAALLEDIEIIRDTLGLERFILCGGGWGALLAILYAQQYPHHVSALLLYQILLGRRQDIDWFYKNGASHIYPDYWSEFTSVIAEESEKDVLLAYDQLLHGTNELARMSAAKAWAGWQAHCSSLQPHINVIDQYMDVHFALTLAFIENHYLKNNFFIEDNAVLNNSHKIRHIPCQIIHGRYNMICPLSGAWLLHEALPRSQLSIVRDAGHSDREPGIIDAIIHASLTLSTQGLDAC